MSSQTTISPRRSRATVGALGVATTLAAWIVWFFVGVILSTGVQLWRNPANEIMAWQWSLIGTLFVAYAVLGLLAGVVMAAALRWFKPNPSELDYRVLTAFVMCFAFVANLVVHWPISGAEQIALLLAVVVACGLMAGLVSEKWRSRVLFLTGPWTLSLFLLGGPWLSREVFTPQDSLFTRIAATLVIPAAIALIAGLRYRARGKPPSLRAQFAFTLVAFGAFVLAALFVGRDWPVRVAVEGSPPRGKPNVLFITMDTVRADHCSLYGYERDTTPNLRELSREATLYSRAVSASDFTLATHAAMFTGLYPDWNGAIQTAGSINQVAMPLEPQHVTLAETLRSAGYWTAEAAANYAFLNSWTGLTRGFSTEEIRQAVGLSTYTRRSYFRESVRRLAAPIIDLQALDRTTLAANDINRRGIAFLERAKSENIPFFLFLNYMDAHTPYIPGAPFNRRYVSGNLRLAPTAISDLMLNVNSGRHHLSHEEAEYLTAEYDGGIAAEDAAIGDLLAQLRNLGLFDNTLIVITADHGDTFGEHGLMDHFLGFVYQELVHVPLLIKYPGQHEAARVDELASQVDLMPTVLDSLGLPLPAKSQGRSLLKSDPDPTRVVYSRGTRSPVVGQGNPRLLGLRRAIFSGSMKLIFWTNGSPELYDLAADPSEEHNLYRADDPTSIKLSDQLNKWISEMPRHNVQGHKLDQATAERLKSLGYVQ